MLIQYKKNPTFVTIKNRIFLPIHTVKNPIGAYITVLQSIESTNNYAMTKVHAGLAKHGEGWFAMEQTAGKGQRGKSWASAPGQNIVFSVALEPFLPPERQFILSMAVALGCYDFFRAHAGEESSIKWPNDIYWRDRKAGGILIENQLKGNRWLYAVAGIGININQTSFPGVPGHPVSLKQITGKESDPLALTRELCGFLEKRYRQLQETPGLITEDYNRQLYKKGEQAPLRSREGLFETFICRVEENGGLVTKADGGAERVFRAGEVEWL